MTNILSVWLEVSYLSSFLKAIFVEYSTPGCQVLVVGLFLFCFFFPSVCKYQVTATLQLNDRKEFFFF